MSESQERLIQFADDVASLAGRYRNQQELSIREMLERTGYPERRETLAGETLRQALARRPEQLGQWLGYSEDKRSRAGWYIRSENGRLEVGKRCSDGTVAVRRSYSDMEEACVDFILHELDEIAFSTSAAR